VKHTPPPTVQGLTFDELVSRAKSSEPQLSPAALDGMAQRFEARLKVEAAMQPLHSAAVNPATSAGKLGVVGKALIGGASVAAVAAFIYSTTFGGSAAPVNPSVRDSALPVAESLPVVGTPITNRGSSVAADERVAPVVGGQLDDEAPKANNNGNPRAKSHRVAPSRLTHANDTKSAIAATESTVAPKPAAADDTAADSTATEQPAIQQPQSAPPAVAAKPAPALDTGLAQLERAERELRSGNPSAALTTLALPVVPSLSSRVEALRAVALCQTGQTAAGRRLGTQHLVRNPRSPYEQRLQRACGDI
jgi:hypothetical protein